MIAAFGGAILAVAGIARLGAIMGIPMIILGVVAIVGGIYALKRRIWGLALTGSISVPFSVSGSWGYQLLYSPL
jgi:hypothetical protein